MFEKVEVLVFGIVENMSVYICSNCGYYELIFGIGGVEKLVEKYYIQLLGQMSLYIFLCEDFDKGMLMVISCLESEFIVIYCQLVDCVVVQFYWQGEVILGEIFFCVV